MEIGYGQLAFHVLISPYHGWMPGGPGREDRCNDRWNFELEEANGCLMTRRAKDGRECQYLSISMLPVRG